MSTKRPQYSIIVPVYNSSDIVEELVKTVKTVMDTAGYSFELILVDDSSIDNVWQQIIKLAANHSFIRGYRLSNNFGQWMASLAGISRARGQFIVTMDDDLEYDPADIITLIEKYSKGDYYLVFGLAKDKYKLQGRLPVLARWRRGLVNIIWQKFLTDSFKLFSRHLVFDGHKFIPKIHFEAFANATLASRHVGYCEVTYRRRFAGNSNHTLIKKIKLFFDHSIEYYRHPGFGFSIAFILIAIVATAYDYIFLAGRFSGLLITFISLANLILLLHMLTYAACVYRRVNGLPDYWIIEETPSPEPL